MDRPAWCGRSRLPVPALSWPPDRSILQRQYAGRIGRGARAHRKQTPVSSSRALHNTPIIGIAGWKKSGKTTLTIRLVEEFTRRGLKVSTVKHAHHAFQIDDNETDSARHRRAGARQVAVVSRRRWAMVSELTGAPEPNLTEVIGWLDPCHLIIVEGYK